MADDIWYRMLASHSSCCGIHVLTAVRNPCEDQESGGMSFYGFYPGMDPNVGWRASEFDSSKWDKAIVKVPDLRQNSGWAYRFKTEKPKAGMQLLRFISLDADVPEQFTMLAENSHGKLIGKVA